MSWFVYVVRCADDSLYTGISMDVERRIKEHNEDNHKGAAYTRARRPVTLIYKEACQSRSEAGKREYEIRQMSKRKKEDLVGTC